MEKSIKLMKKVIESIDNKNELVALSEKHDSHLLNYKILELALSEVQDKEFSNDEIVSLYKPYGLENESHLSEVDYVIARIFLSIENGEHFSQFMDFGLDKSQPELAFAAEKVLEVINK